jgi:hypothetical protein
MTTGPADCCVEVADSADVTRAVAAVSAALDASGYAQPDRFFTELATAETLVSAVQRTQIPGRPHRLFLWYDITPDRLDIRVLHRRPGEAPATT